MNPLILTLDVGTTACKAMLFELDGTVMGSGEAEYPVSHPYPTWAEQDADDWWRAALDAGRQALSTREPGREIAAIGLSSQRETVVPVAADGRTLRPAILWMDRRSTDQAQAFAADFGRKTIYHRTGLRPDATFSATKLLWLKEHTPDILRDARWILQPRDFLAYRLTGRAATEPSLASRTMLLDVQEDAWITEFVRRAGIEVAQLPEIIRSQGVVGKVTRVAADLLGLTAGIPVVAGGGDRACEALGAGLRENGVMESTGTTSNVSCVSRMPASGDSQAGRVLGSRHVLPQTWLIEQGLTTTGAVLRWFRDNLAAAETAQAAEEGRSVYDVIAAGAASRPPGANGLLLLPFFMGANATRWNPKARGAFFGLTLDHTRNDLARSIMEGVAYEIRACFVVLEDLGLRPTQVRVMGGGSKADVWNQIKADILGVEVGVPRVTETASLGAMVLAAWGVGLLDDPITAAANMNGVERTYHPDRDTQQTYQVFYDVYEALYAGLEPVYDKLAEVFTPER